MPSPLHLHLAGAPGSLRAQAAECVWDQEELETAQ